MSDTLTAEPVVTPIVKTGKTMKSKPKAKPAPKKDEKKKKETNPGLRKPQIRILAVLAKSNKPLTRMVISEKAPVDQASCVEYIGSHDADVRKANDEKHFPSLVSLGLVKFGNNEESGAVCYEISAKGKAAYDKIK